MFEINSSKLVENKINYKKFEIKHGCTEYYEKYPDFKKINFKGKQEMFYDNMENMRTLSIITYHILVKELSVQP